jgi:hypothetical protein
MESVEILTSQARRNRSKKEVTGAYIKLHNENIPFT